MDGNQLRRNGASTPRSALTPRVRLPAITRSDAPPVSEASRVSDLEKASGNIDPDAIENLASRVAALVASPSAVEQKVVEIANRLTKNVEHGQST